MAKLFTGILGGGRGKVGGVIMGRWKGINYVRGYAAPANPRTQAQVQSRNKFTVATKKAAAFTAYLRALPNMFAGISNFNYVVSEIRNGKAPLVAAAAVGEGGNAFNSITVNRSAGTVVLAGNMLAGDRIVVLTGDLNRLELSSEARPNLYEITLNANSTNVTVNAIVPANYFALATLVRANRARLGVFTSETLGA